MKAEKPLEGAAKRGSMHSKGRKVGEMGKKRIGKDGETGKTTNPIATFQNDPSNSLKLHVNSTKIDFY